MPVHPGSHFRVNSHWNVTEICTLGSDDLVASFRAEKHAIEFCQIYKLVISIGACATKGFEYSKHHRTA